MSETTYLQFIDYTHNAVKQNEELKNGPQNLHEEAYLPFGLSTYQTIINLQRWQIAPALLSPSQVHGAIELIAKHCSSHSTAPADKQINMHPTTPHIFNTS